MAFTPKERRRLLDAVVSLATQDGLGETVFWETVEPALIEIVANPTADRELRKLLRLINDLSVIETLEDWFARAARERAADARKATTSAEELVAPVKRFGYGFGAAGIAGTVLGTAALPVALPLIALGLVLSAGGLATGYRLRRKADDATFDGTMLKQLADICKQEREGRR